ncbi:unnamed protein product [Eruca vesicaria subsp. sativa]|uniref:Uncharacterized protein n=1 Tax=Eruca vesicaria subsp. sativa TaxID=29727 RepID=A0ABC8KMW8_ERUVS|nr:unnamed protein product [Eruca vesicaria subsp. sativa]
MNKDQERAAVTQVETAEMGCVAKTRAFLEIPNPAIVKVLAISSSATFTSGIALAFEWLFHGRSHTTGFGWIIYYALFLIFLPLLILIGLRILMAISCPSQSVDSVAEVKEECVEAQQTEINSCRSLAVVVDSDERKKNREEEETPRIKRAVSFPSHGKVRSCRTR